MQPIQNEELSQNVIDELYIAGYSLYEHGKYKEALSFFEILAAKKPGEIKYWVALGAVNQMLKQYNDAVVIYATAALLDSQKNNPYIHLHAAECFFSMNEKKNGFSALDEAERIARKNTKFIDVISRAIALRSGWQTPSR